MAPITIGPASTSDAPIITAILSEAEAWLEAAGMPLWWHGELEPEKITAEVAAGQFFLAWRAGEAVGTVRFQLEDALFWPDAEPESAAYVHRLAVRRTAAGTGVATALLQWAVGRCRELGRTRLRLDCPLARPKLRKIYEDFGFVLHSERQIGPYQAARYEMSIGLR